MHPYLAERLARQHVDDITRMAAKYKIGTGHRHRETERSLRYRTGWTLIQLGLRMASPAEARRLRQETAQRATGRRVPQMR